MWICMHPNSFLGKSTKKKQFSCQKVSKVDELTICNKKCREKSFALITSYSFQKLKASNTSYKACEKTSKFSIHVTYHKWVVLQTYGDDKLHLTCFIIEGVYIGPGTTWANEMNLVVNHAPGAGSIASPVDLQSDALSLCYGCPPKQNGLSKGKGKGKGKGVCLQFRYSRRVSTIISTRYWNSLLLKQQLSQLSMFDEAIM